MSARLSPRSMPRGNDVAICVFQLCSLRVVHLSEPARFWPAGTNRKRQTAHVSFQESSSTAKPWTKILLDWTLDLNGDLVSQTWKIKTMRSQRLLQGSYASLFFFFRGFPSPQSFVQQNKTCNTRSFKKLSYSSHMTETGTEFQTCRGARLHQGGLKFPREFLKNHQVPGRSKFHQGGQNNSPGRVPPGLWQRV